MKAVVTILQCRRVALPHVMARYVVPRMRETFPGEVELVIIQHRADASGGNARLETNRAGTADERLALVRRWTEEGRYEGAHIVPHEINHPPYPSIPSTHLSVREALDRDADFHLWLEDDALVDDTDCDRWDALLGGTEVGVYRRFQHLNSAFLLTRPSFDRRIVDKLGDYGFWNPRSRLEVELRRNMRTRRTYLPMRHAVRYHHRYYPYTGLRYVVQRVREIAPEALPLLDEDFGPGTAELPPVTAEEMRQHEAADGARPLDRLSRVRQRLVERFLLPGEL
ncbi:MAG: hypothetical protein PVI30_23065 [Myxococcales bacterium]